MNGSEGQRSGVAAAQADVREVYHGGWIGPVVSAVVWLAAGLSADRMGMGVGSAVLFLGGVLIPAVSMAGNRVLGDRADLPAGHPMRGLAMQSAFGMVAGLLAAWLLAGVLPGAFFPLAMVVVGAHYFTFMHLYGEVVFLVGGVVQVLAGLVILAGDTSPTLGAYVMTGLLVLMSGALLLRHRARAT
ncbi:DUF7010 family protein [Ornithinimicrobium pekingense]|uniref:DUF308 domain-containing protein n=1 Tax=Ornithinimicrobium pekingense TaxID=384677 RepID=A0ABQ2FF73_9MICO|nr:hypothetical protein [Ornithinimicrobium pekingense]GGK83270.1 hypothetical protein GCM10011509_34640 [Ornithinimicrobium pekingense]